MTDTEKKILKVIEHEIDNLDTNSMSQDSLFHVKTELTWILCTVYIIIKDSEEEKDV